MSHKLLWAGIMACILVGCAFLEVVIPPDHVRSPAITPTLAPPLPVNCAQVENPVENAVLNGGFEVGETGWTLHSEGTGATWRPHPLISGESPHTGALAARLGGYEGSIDQIRQRVTIPPDGVLTYWWRINAPRLSSQLAISLLPPDEGRPLLLAAHNDKDPAAGWQQDCFDLSAYAGHTYILAFDLRNDNYTMTAFDVDDVVLGHPAK